MLGLYPSIATNSMDFLRMLSPIGHYIPQSFLRGSSFAANIKKNKTARGKENYVNYTFCAARGCGY